MSKKHIVNDYALILAAMGRCGSTMLYNSLKSHFSQDRFEKDLKKEYQSGILIKTHDFAPLVLKNCRAIYIFGDPRNSVISAHTKGKIDIPRHYVNMHSQYSRAIVKRSLFANTDTLRLSDNFHSWYRQQSYPLLTIRYEDLYDNLDILYDFLGFKFNLPAKKDRDTNWKKHPKSDQINDTYRVLYTEVQAVPAIKKWEAGPIPETPPPPKKIKQHIPHSPAPKPNRPSKHRVIKQIDNKKPIPKIYAIILGMDSRIEFMNLVIQSYNTLWPGNNFIFRVPYNEVKPNIKADNVELIQVPKSIRKTMDGLLSDIEDDDFVYWCTDDRYPIKMATPDFFKIVAQNLSSIDFDAIRLLRFPNVENNIKLQIKDVLFKPCQKKKMPRGWWHHQFVRAKILRRVFVENELPDNYNHAKINGIMLRNPKKFDHNILLPNMDLLVLGEPTVAGKITLNCVESMKKFGITIPPDSRTCDQRVLFGEMK